MLEASKCLYVFKHGSRFFMLVALQRDKLADVRTRTRVGTCDSPRTLFFDIFTRECCEFLAHALPKRTLRRLQSTHCVEENELDPYKVWR